MGDLPKRWHGMADLPKRWHGTMMADDPGRTHYYGDGCDDPHGDVPFATDLCWTLVPFEHGVELHCPSCGHVMYHDGASIRLDDLTASVTAHRCTRES
jgi:predicted RNA-binding Zn-ribbon protein involved in translation (DUF1610 family)